MKLKKFAFIFLICLFNNNFSKVTQLNWQARAKSEEDFLKNLTKYKTVTKWSYSSPWEFDQNGKCIDGQKCIAQVVLSNKEKDKTNLYFIVEFLKMDNSWSTNEYGHKCYKSSNDDGAQYIYDKYLDNKDLVEINFFQEN